MNNENMYEETVFDLSKVPFDKVNNEFKKDFIEYYNGSIDLLSSPNALNKASGANRIGILKKMFFNMDKYNTNTDFESSYHNILKESEPYTET